MIVFANMPVSAIERPSIALGLLKSILGEAGIESSTLNLNLLFAEYVGIDSYRLLEATRPQDLIGEWIFAPAAFGDRAEGPDSFLDFVQSRDLRLFETNRERTKADLRKLHGLTAPFIDECVDRILALKPRVVGCTSMFQQNVASLALLRRIRERAPDVITMMGGANCESVMGRTMHAHFPWVDYIVSGEADAMIVDLMRDILARGRDIPAEQLPLGVYGPDHRVAGYPQVSSGDGAPRAVVEDIRDLPLPDYSDYFRELGESLYGEDIYPGLPVETSRGCWWGAKSHCTFCGLNGGTLSYRSKAPDRALADIETLVARHGIDRIEVVDNILDSKYLTTLVPELAAREQPLSIFYEVKANLKKSQLEMMAQAGIRFIQPGIESLDTRVLKLMRKGCASWQNILLLKWARQYGIRVAWSVIHGFPGEEDDWHRETAELMPLLHHLQSGGFVGLRYDRYSPYFNQPDAWKLKLVAGSAYGRIYPLPPAALADLAYFMEDEGGAGPVQGPGYLAMRDAWQAWQASQSRAGPPLWQMPTLSMRRGADGTVRITDTRACAVVDGALLSPVQGAILDAADSAPPCDQLCARIAAAFNIAADIVEDMARSLIAYRLLVQLDGRYVSLVNEEPIALRPRPRDLPHGFVRRHQARRRLDSVLTLAPVEPA